MDHEESTGKPQDRVAMCAACGQNLPREAPCHNEQCPVKVAAEIRTAAAQTSFRLGC